MELNILLSFIAFAELGIILYLHNQQKKPVKTMDARELLHDLTKGRAMVRIEVIDQEGLMIHRSR